MFSPDFGLFTVPTIFFHSRSHSRFDMAKCDRDIFSMKGEEKI